MIDTDKVGRRVAEGAILGWIVLVCLSQSHHVTVIETKCNFTVSLFKSWESSRGLTMAYEAGRFDKCHRWSSCLAVREYRRLVSGRHDSNGTRCDHRRSPWTARTLGSYVEYPALRLYSFQILARKHTLKRTTKNFKYVLWWNHFEENLKIFHYVYLIIWSDHLFLHYEDLKIFDSDKNFKIQG